MNKKLTYGERLKNFRDSKNLSQQDIADALTVSRETISIIENDHQEPSSKTKRLLKQKFHYDIANNVMQDEPASYGEKVLLSNFDLQKLMGDINERLIRIEAHVEVYESAIAGLQSRTKHDFMEKVGGLRTAVKEVSNRRFSELATKYG